MLRTSSNFHNKNHADNGKLLGRYVFTNVHFRLLLIEEWQLFPHRTSCPRLAAVTNSVQVYRTHGFLWFYLFFNVVIHQVLFKHLLGSWLIRGRGTRFSVIRSHVTGEESRLIVL